MKPTTITTTILLAAAALAFAGCGKTGDASAPAAKPAAQAATAASPYHPADLQFSDAALTKMKSLGKTEKGTRIVYWVKKSDTVEYSVSIYTGDKITESMTYAFFGGKNAASSYATMLKAYEGSGMILDKDDTALWFRIKESSPSKMTWQTYYDEFKTMKSFNFVE